MKINVILSDVCGQIHVYMGTWSLLTLNSVNRNGDNKLETINAQSVKN